MGLLSVLHAKLTAAKELADSDVDILLRYTGLRWTHDDVEPGQAIAFGFCPVKLEAVKLNAGYKAMQQRRRTLLEGLFFNDVLNTARRAMTPEQKAALRQRLRFLKQKAVQGEEVSTTEYELRPFDWSVPMGIRRMSNGTLVDFF